MSVDPSQPLTPRPAPLPNVDLPSLDNPRMPVDGGLAALGLVSLAAASVGIVGVIYLFVTAVTVGAGGMRGGILPMLLVFAASLVRSGFHLGVARGATKRRADIRDAALRYLVVSIIHTVLVIALMMFVWLGGPSTSALPALLTLALFLLGWPVTVWLLVNRRIVKRIFSTVDTFDVGIVPADRGVGSAGVLMTVFATLFLVLDLGIIAFILAQDGPLGTGMILWLVTVFLFAGRSVIHLVWGVSALRGRMDYESFRRMTQTYLWLAFITVLAALGAMFAMEELRVAFRRAPFNIIFFAVVITTALMAWPASLRAFAQDAVPFWDTEQDARRPFRPAVDRGLTALGYLHLWFFVFGFSAWVAGVLGMNALGVMPGATSADASALDLVASLAGLGLQLWVALELIGMTARYQLAAAVYAGAAVLLAVLQLFVMGDLFAELDGAGGPIPTITILISTATSLVMPITTFVLSRGKPPLTM